MTVFACAQCDAVLTVSVSQVALPVHAHHTYGHELLPSLMESGTYAVDPEPWGPPWRLWSEVGADEPETRGIYAPVHSLSYGPPGAIVVAPGDVRSTVLIPERCDGDCCGLDGRAGPNLACARCGRAVATRIDDCSLWQAVWFDPQAVRRVAGEDATRRVISWEALHEEQLLGTPAVEPSGAWSPLWEAAVGAALARLLAASAGTPVTVPDGPVAEAFRHALNTLLPPGPSAKKLALAGPGLSAHGADIALVPQHPQTNEAWTASGTPVVPLVAEVWVHLAFQRDRKPVPVVSEIPDAVRRDDPPPLLPLTPFRPDPNVFLYTLARLPEVRQPWLRTIYDHVKHRPYAAPF